MSRLGEAAVEWKLDGVRVQVHRSGGDVSVFTRSLDEITDRVPEVVEAVAALPVRDVVLDGEAIALRPDGRPRPFQETGSRVSSRVDVTAARAAAPLSTYVFDVLHLDGEDVLDRPGRDRAEVLEAAVPEPLRVPRVVTADVGGGADVLAGAVARGHEGVVAKALDAPYEAGPAGGRLAQGQAAAHAGPGGAGRRVGARAPPRLAVEPAPRCPRPGRRLRDAGQDVQGADRRDARLADRAAAGAGRRQRRAGSSRCGRSWSSRSRSTGCRPRRATRAGWRCGSPGCCGTGRTSDRRRPTRSTRSGRSTAGEVRTARAVEGGGGTATRAGPGDLTSAATWSSAGTGRLLRPSATPRPRRCRQGYQRGPDRRKTPGLTFLDARGLRGGRAARSGWPATAARWSSRASGAARPWARACSSWSRACIAARSRWRSRRSSSGSVCRVRPFTSALSCAWVKTLGRSAVSRSRGAVRVVGRACRLCGPGSRGFTVTPCTCLAGIASG